MNRFHVVLIKPSHYDRDGYVIQWWRSAMPSNSLAAVQGLAQDCAERQVLGPDVTIDVSAYDESNTRIRPDRLARTIHSDGGRGLIALIGVQTNQYPRALDLARQFRAQNLPVCIGGFHVSGCLSMLPGITPEIQEAIDMGVSVFAGEAEGRLEIVMKDAFRGELKPIYNFIKDLPDLQDAPVPFLPADRVKQCVGSQSSFDAGRGCPFTCSFCTIINVQGRKSRFRSEDDIEKIIRENVRQGIHRFFITDDNFARNKNWEPIYDRLIELRQREGIKFNLALQVDTACHRIPRFIEKSAAAGVKRVFIGLESINPENLKSTSKRQNKISEYKMGLQAWKQVGVFTICGYIIGFPGETPETIARDIETIKRELPVDLLEFTVMTPLPGSQDHRELYDQGVAMDPDLNKYDLNQRVIRHPRMSDAEWEQAYHDAWLRYYSVDHIITLMKRAYVNKISPGKILGSAVWFLATIAVEHVHPLESGYVRRKYRKDRRPCFPIEKPVLFHLRFILDFLYKHIYTIWLLFRLNRERNKILANPRAKEYMDLSLRPDAADLTVPQQQAVGS
jgi:pyruvate-formate lyase-activating enzyme